jgi:hypothetical protein
MSNLKLYQFAILWHPNKEQKEKEVKTKLVVEPTTILASNDQVAQMMAVKAIPEEYTEQLDQIDIAIRPF